MNAELETLIQIAADETGVDVASLYLFEDESLVLRATFGLQSGMVGQVRMSPSEGLTGAAFREEKALVVVEPALHPAYRFFPGSGEEEFHSFLGVPLSGKTGVLVFQTREPKYFSSSEVRVARVWADYILQALGKAPDPGAPESAASGESKPAGNYVPRTMRYTFATG